MPHFTTYPDLASRDLAGRVVSANDELFAPRQSLNMPRPAVHAVDAFGHLGKVYDGWETRRRRTPGFDWAIVRLGVPGVVHGVVVDTAFFKGNYPPFVSVEGASVEGYPEDALARVAGVDDPRGARRPARATPRTTTRSRATGAGPTCGCPSTPTAASRGSGCTARSCWTRAS